MYVILQGYKKLPRTVNKDGSATERYRLLVSDGQKLNSFTMLATQLNDLITEDILNEYAICKITNYHLSAVNNSGKEKYCLFFLHFPYIKIYKFKHQTLFYQTCDADTGYRSVGFWQRSRIQDRQSN